MRKTKIEPIKNYTTGKYSYLITFWCECGKENILSFKGVGTYYCKCGEKFEIIKAGKTRDRGRSKVTLQQTKHRPIKIASGYSSIGRCFEK
ncbi:MAG: hypothetical protein ACFFKA_20220 [Candidatus Thorarchaeota archaeon]